MKQGKIGEADHWCMDSGADMCFIAEDLLPTDYMDGPPVHAKGAMHPEGKMCPTAVFNAEVDGKKTRMLAAVAQRQVLPYPAIVGRNGSGLHIQWDVKVTTTPNVGLASDEAGEPSSQVLEESAKEPELLQKEIDLTSITDAQILAVQTRAQRRRQELLQQADAAATTASGAVIHSLVDTPLANGSSSGGALMDRDVGANTSNSLPKNTPGSEFTPVEAEEDDTSSVATLEYAVRDDVLYGLNLQPKADENPYKIVVPTPLREKILRLGHDKSGHFSRKKTRDHIYAHFTWPGIGKDIQEYCQKCTQCAKYNSHQKDTQPQQVVPVITSPWRKLAMDVVGPLTKTSSGYRYILTVIDLATRYPVAVPMRRVDVQTTCTELVEIFASYDVPEEIVHDNGGNFTAQLMEEVLGTMGIQQIRTSPYHPEANGAIERMHGTLKKALKKAGSKASTWDRWLPYVLYTLRTTVHDATGFSPFHLLFGRRPDTPISSFRGILEDPVEDLPQPVEQYLKQLQARMKMAQEVAGDKDHKAKLSSKAYQDEKKKAEESTLEPGTHVLCREPKKKRGLSAVWQGPFTIKKRLGLATYLLDVGRGRTKRRHRNALKVYLPEEVNVCSLLTALADDEAMDGVELETLLNIIISS